VSYIADHWTVRIPRFDEETSSLFKALAAVLRPAIDPIDFQRLQSQPSSLWDQTWVDLIPLPALNPLVPEIVATIDGYAGELQIKYAWKLIRDHLESCQIYISASEICIRPYLPPTFSHRSFASASQRVYMSATLGEGGELERITGRPAIDRLPIPEGWDKQGIGRRFFIFPGKSLTPKEETGTILNLVSRAKKGLFLVPSEKVATSIKETVEKTLGFETFGARDIEQSKDPFTQASQAVAVVANRYDGIDFPKNECRLLVILGVPSATNLQEKFLVSRMGAYSVLADRIRTRIVQAFGRCTRSATDYSAVVIAGEELPTYLLKKEGRQYFHPELQAEIRFGIDQSDVEKSKEFLENFDHFLKQDSEWSGANDAILNYRSSCHQSVLPNLSSFREAVKSEIEFSQRIWDRDYAGGIESCREILRHLDAPEQRGYRALWYYLAGCTAWLAHQQRQIDSPRLAEDYFSRAARAAPALPWLRKCAKFGQVDSNPAEAVDLQVALLVERMEQQLEDLGTLHDAKYIALEKSIRDGLASSEASAFERAQRDLGSLLGYEAGNQETTGAPDPWWMVNGDLCLVFEDHSDGAIGGTISVKKARQVATHPNWIKSNVTGDDNTEVVPILVTPAANADSDALPHLAKVLIWPLEEFRTWAEMALQKVREFRRTFSGAGDLVWKAETAKGYVEAGLDPRSIIQGLSAADKKLQK
jgi:hypothetical protein